MKTTLSRRSFLQRATGAGATILILRDPRLAFAYEANARLNVSGVGIGGQGRGNLDQIAKAGSTIVALCDVDEAQGGGTFTQYPQARRFRDFRRMLDELEGEIDAVAIATPDHTHAVAAVDAMRRGKPVFCEKPLSRTVRESRVMRDVAREQKVVTQMGNQGSASNGLRRAVEYVWEGTIGEVREAHLWFSGGNGPKTLPTDRPPVPATLDWDLWLGPAPERAFHPSYLPGRWRGWRAFGSGIVGDFGCHTANLLFRALRLEQLWEPPAGQAAGDARIRVEARPSEINAEGYPRALTAMVDLPARGALPPVKLTVYAAERPAAALLLGHPRGDWGDLLVGTKGSIYSECPWNTRFVLLPEERFADAKGGPPQKLPVSRGHHREWVEACKGNGETFSPFAIGGPLTELMQLINLATLIEGPIEFDPVNCRIPNHPAADALLHREYRSGWKL